MKTKSLERILKPAGITMSENHVYTAENGDLYTGCTTISGAWRKDFLAPWYALEMFKEASKRIGEIGLALKDASDPSAAIKILEECKGAAKRKADQAKNDGTDAHDHIRVMIQAKIEGKKKFTAPKKLNKESQNAVNAFMAWAKQNKIEWLASEELVASHEYKVGGTVDAIAVVDGLTYLLDFKTSSQVGEDALLQLAGYDVMLSEMGLQVMGHLILRLPKDGTSAETLTITNAEDMKFFRETFLRMREAHKFFIYMVSKFKEATTKKMKVDEKPIESIPSVLTKKKVVLRRKTK